MQAFKKIVVGYFVYYGVTSFLNNLAQHYIAQQAMQAKLEAMKGGNVSIVDEARKNGGYM